jgi:hypothetical protein
MNGATNAVVVQHTFLDTPNQTPSAQANAAFLTDTSGPIGAEPEPVDPTIPIAGAERL